MTTLVGISGSLRKGSYNTALLRAAAAQMPAGSTLEVKTIHGIPLYDEDVETASGIPPAVSALKDAIAVADGLLIVTPEYNNTMPGVLKNAIDWLTRPPADVKRVFSNKPVAITGASTGGFGTILSQNSWLPVLRTLGTRPWFGGRLLISRAQNVFDDAGNLKDASIKAQIQAFMQGFVEFAQRR